MDGTAPVGMFGPLSPGRLRIVTWNVWWRYGPWRERQRAIVEVLRRLDPDVVALQEAWEGPEGSTVALLRDELGLDGAFAGHPVGDPADGLRSGNAVVSRWGVAEHEHHPLPTGIAVDERRLLLRADIDGPRGPIRIWCTHLSWRPDHGAVRLEQAEEVVRLMGAAAPVRGVRALCGDLNAEPHSDELRTLTGHRATAAPGAALVDAFAATGDGPGWTWDDANPFAAPNCLPRRRIDYVLCGLPGRGGVGTPLACRIAGTEPVGGTFGSDHWAVVADVRG